MKSRITRTLSIGIAMVAAAALYAQDKTVTATVPFSFYMGSTLMPQGTYRVSELSRGTVVWMKSMAGDSTKSATVIRVAGQKETEPARLVFRRYGENYFLAQIWTGTAGTGSQLGKSTREKEFAQNGAAPTLAVIRLVAHP